VTLALGIELLSGRYAATAYNDRDAAEWPPHPARVFSALVATWADHDDDEPGRARAARERDALRYIEALPPPTVLASGSGEAGLRSVAPVFVPVNDVSVVSSPSREKLDEAIETLATASDPKVRAKLEKEIAKLEAKLAADTAKAIAAPSKFSKEDLNGRILPELRTKQPRTFPSVHPAEPRFVLVWDEAEADSETTSALDGLLARVVRVGHSSSLVQARRYDAAALDGVRASLTSFEPDDEDGDLVLRWVASGQLEQLDRAFQLHRETEPRVLPARFARYREGARVAENVTPHSVFDSEPIVLARVGGPRLPIVSTTGVAQQLRKALMAATEQPVAEILSGHRDGGGASTQPHLAITPLPFVGSEHDATDGDRNAVQHALEKLEQGSEAAEPGVIPLLLGESGVLELERVVWGESSRVTLRAGTWTRAAHRWASATPVALDQNPGNLHDPDPQRRATAFAEARESVAQSVERIGLPRPTSVDVVRSAVLSGTAKPRMHPRFPTAQQKPQRVLVHVRLEFSAPVRGPLLLGAGRYLGLGLCMPVGEDVPLGQDGRHG
jgi:CRISPR-associated protein Csb2